MFLRNNHNVLSQALFTYLLNQVHPVGIREMQADQQKIYPAPLQGVYQPCPLEVILHFRRGKNREQIWLNDSA